MNLKTYSKPLKQGENIEITADLGLLLNEAHNPEVVGLNPAPATNKILRAYFFA